MVASIEERARRRKTDFARMGIVKSIDEISAEIAERDRKDSSRVHSPLRKATDALEIDTTLMTMQEQVRFIVEKAKEYSRARK
jgi:cytidylate kinase